jgi:hypothetical protein
MLHAVLQSGPSVGIVHHCWRLICTRLLVIIAG